MKCPNCGEEISKDSLYCGSCGTRIHEAEKKKNQLTLIICGVSLIAVVLGLFTFIYVDNPSAHSGRPIIIYQGEKENGQLLFEIISSSCTYHGKYAGDRIKIDFFNGTPSASTYYGYAPALLKTVARNQQSFSVDVDNIYEHHETVTGDAIFNYDDKKTLERGVQYVARISGKHNGVLFKRPAKDLFCEFSLDKPSGTIPEQPAVEESKHLTVHTSEPQNMEQSHTTISKQTPKSGESANNTAGTRETNVNSEIDGNGSSNATTTASKEAGHEWVDLGVGTKWATCNIGSSFPAEGGQWFAWGETKPKATSSWSNYLLRSSGDDINNVIFTKYNTNGKWGEVDNRSRLDSGDDAARQTWGGKWRIPTKAEWQDLISRCSWSWTSKDGISGYMVTGTNGNSIFLPTAGRQGIYWSSSLNQDRPVSAWTFVMLSGNHYVDDYDRCCQFMIRPVF